MYMVKRERTKEGSHVGAPRPRCEGILHDPSHTILWGSHRLASLPHDGILVTELQYLLYLDPRYSLLYLDPGYSTTVEAIMVHFVQVQVLIKLPEY